MKKTLTCNECFVAIESGSYCKFCKCFMQSSNTNTGASMKKSSKNPIVISDLSFYSNALAFGNSSFDLVAKESDYQTNDDGDMNEEDIASFEELINATIHNTEYLENRDKEYEENLEYSKAVLDSFGVSYDNMSDKLIEAYASHMKCLDEAPNSNKRSNELVVEVKVQRLNPETNNWYNVKKIAPFVFEVSDIFEVDTDGNILDFKYSTDYTFNAKTRKMEESIAPLVKNIMKSVGLTTIHQYSFVNPETNEFETKILKQRFAITSSAFTESTVLNGMNVGTAVAPFFHSIDEEGNVVKEPTFYAYDAAVDFENGIVVIPNTNDESHGDAASRLFDQGIQIGTSVATQAMMHDDIEIEEIAARIKEEKKLEKIARGAKINTNLKKYKIQKRNTEILNSEVGHLVHELIEDSYLMDADIQASVVERFKQNADRLDEVMSAVVAYRSVHGKGLSYPMYKVLDGMIRTSARKKVAEEVDTDILVTIKRLNNSTLSIKQLIDEEVVAVYETALKYRKENVACNLVLPVAKEMKVRYAQIKNIKVA